MTIKLTDTQLVMMSAAAQRADRCLTPPDKLKGAAAGKVSAKLIEAGLARETKAKPGMAIWSRDEEGQSFALKLTAAGLKAIAVDDDTTGEPPQAIGKGPENASQRLGSSDDIAASSEGAEAAPRASSKLALVIGMLRRPEGATVDDLTKATGWLPHTTRAAITGLRKRGYSVTRDKSDAGVSAYRIPGAPVEAAESRSDETSIVFNRSRQGSKARKAA